LFKLTAGISDCFLVYQHFLFFSSKKMKEKKPQFSYAVHVPFTLRSFAAGYYENMKGRGRGAKKNRLSRRCSSSVHLRQVIVGQQKERTSA
jgi:hypothetical protein